MPTTSGTMFARTLDFGDTMYQNSLDFGYIIYHKWMCLADKFGL